LLAKMTGRTGWVDAFEIDPQLAEKARGNLADVLNVRVHTESGSGSTLPSCDAIYVNAGATAPVENWLNALRVGGRLLFPLTDTRHHGAMLLIKRAGGDQFDARFVSRAAFVPCSGARDENVAGRLSEVFQRQDIAAVRSLRLNTPPDESCWFAGPNWWLSTSASAGGSR
jgi:protein-L-isoaspartate(D-aspartate) O-methyltransferase